MSAQSIRQTLIWSLVATMVWSTIMYVIEDESTISGTLAMSPVLFVIMFFTMRMTNRFTGALTRRMIVKRSDPERSAAADASTDAESGPVAASSMRPEHAQRRRTRRRRRRGRR